MREIAVDVRKDSLPGRYSDELEIGGSLSLHGNESVLAPNSRYRIALGVT